MPLGSLEPPRPLYRIGRFPDPWAWPSWDYQHADGTFGNRWDDPQGRFRVLYATSQRLGTFLEVLARFRPDPEVVAGLAEIAGEDDALAPGSVPRSFLELRLIGEATIRGRFADVAAAKSLAHLREALASRLVQHGLADLDASAIRSATRGLTQDIAHYVYELTDDLGEPVYRGIAYASRLGDDQRCWALFETPALEAGWLERGPCAQIDAADPDLQRALTLFGLALV